MNFDINAALAQTNFADQEKNSGAPFVNLKKLPTVTNSGFYSVHIQSAYVREGTGFNGQPRTSIELQGIATLESDPSHSGAIRLYVDLPTGDPNEPRFVFVRFSELLAACKSLNASGHPYFSREERISQDGQSTFVVSPALEDKNIYVWVKSKMSQNGKRYMNAYAFYDSDKRSAFEAQTNSPAKRFQSLAASLPSEGLPLGPSQEQASSAQAAANPFAPPAPVGAPAMQASPYAAQATTAYPATGAQATNAYQAMAPQAQTVTPINSPYPVQQGANPYQAMAPQAQASAPVDNNQDVIPF